MSESDNKKKNRPDELDEVRSLIADADAGSFDLEDILAEFGGTPHQRKATPMAPVPIQRSRSSIVAFPGAAPLDDEPEEPAPQPEEELEEDTLSPDDVEEDIPAPEPEETEEEAPPADEDAPQTEVEETDEEEPREDFPQEEEVEEDREDTGPLEPRSPIIQFPTPPKRLPPFLAALVEKVDRRAWRYARQMYAEDERTDPDEVRRLERLIPGTDREAEPAPQAPKRQQKQVKPPPPDTDPKQLIQIFGRGLRGARTRQLGLLVLCLLSVVMTAIPALGFIFVPPLNSPLVQNGISAALLAGGLLLGYDVVWAGLTAPFQGRVEMETISALSVLFTLGDCVALIIAQSQRLPYTAAALIGLYLLMLGRYHLRCAQRLSCRTAAASSAPYRVTLDEGKWNNRDTYCKWTGDASGFGCQIQTEDGAQQIYEKFCPVVVVLSTLFTLYIAFARPSDALWCASALFTACTAFGSAIPYGRSFHLVARRLTQVGAALAGWPGVVGSRQADRVLITDTDLFPTGYVELNGFKVMGDFPVEQVVAYTATVIRDSGSGLTKPFHDYLRTLGGLMRNSQRLCCYEGGGLSANIRGDQVLVGSAAFMNLMDIPLPPGLNVKNAVFCAINGELAGIFALSYSLPDTVFPALDCLLQERVGPVLATRDFNLIPAMLKQRFKLAADQMDFPPVERRRELSDPDQSHSPVLAAILCREGLQPFADALVCAKRLRRATRIGGALCCMSSALGLVLSAYLVSVAAYGSLSPLNLLLYLVIWLIPVWLLSAWVHNF